MVRVRGVSIEASCLAQREISCFPDEQWVATAGQIGIGSYFIYQSVDKVAWVGARRAKLARGDGKFRR